MRLHEPAKFGDDLSTHRIMVTYVNKNIKPIIGIEVGAGGTGLRVISPIFDSQNKHIGSVELGSSLKPILNHLAKLFHLSYSIAINKSVFENIHRIGKSTDVTKDEFVYYDFSNENAKLNTKTYSIYRNRYCVNKR